MPLKGFVSLGGAQCKCISRHSYKSELSIWSLDPCSNCNPPNPPILPVTHIFQLGGIAPLHIGGAVRLVPFAWEERTGSIAAGRDVMPPALEGCCWHTWSLDPFTVPSCSLVCGRPPHQPQRNGRVGGLGVPSMQQQQTCILKVFLTGRLRFKHGLVYNTLSPEARRALCCSAVLVCHQWYADLPTPHSLSPQPLFCPCVSFFLPNFVVFVVLLFLNYSPLLLLIE